MSPPDVNPGAPGAPSQALPSDAFTRLLDEEAPQLDERPRAALR